VEKFGEKTKLFKEYIEIEFLIWTTDIYELTKLGNSRHLGEVFLAARNTQAEKKYGWYFIQLGF